MPQVHFVKSARPAKSTSMLALRESAGIEVGDSYYWWTFYKSPPTLSKTRPRPSQLTRSKWSRVYVAQEAIEDATDASELQAAVEGAVDRLGTIRDEYNTSADAIELKFEGSPTAEACRERANRLDELISELADKTSEVTELMECQTCDGAKEVDCDECEDGVLRDEDGEEEDEECGACSGTCKVECTECPGADAFTDVHQDLMDLEWSAPC